MTFEKILKHVGEYDTYQKKIVWYYYIPVVSIFVFFCMSTFFMLSEPDAWCKVPELDPLSPEVQHKLSRPTINDKLDKCHVYDLDYAEVFKDFMSATE